MRFVLTSILAIVAGAYAGASFFFYEQESWARFPSEIELESSPRLRHPEATLGLTRHAIESKNFSGSILPYLRQSLKEAPASYQSPFLLAAFLANRLEERELTERAFEATIELSPSNGRLRFAYAQWLLTPRVEPLRIEKVASRRSDEFGDARRRGLGHLALAMKLEPDLVPASLKLVAWSGVPADKWRDLTPETVPARKELALALARSSHRTEALDVLAGVLESASEREFFFDAARWAFEWNAPAIALRTGQEWLEQEDRSGRAGRDFARAALVVARAHLELGQPERAYEAFSEALKKVERHAGASSSASVELLRGMGYQYLRADQVVMAESLLLKATEAAPNDPDSRLGLARVYRKAGKRRASIEAYREVLRLHPQHSQADGELRQLLLLNKPSAEGS